MGTTTADLETNIDTYLKVIGVRNRAYLQRTMLDASVRRAYAEVVTPINLIYKGPRVAVATVDFLLADPFFRSDTQYSLEVDVDTTAHAMDVVNAGSAEEHSAIITFTGPMEHQK